MKKLPFRTRTGALDFIRFRRLKKGPTTNTTNVSNSNARTRMLNIRLLACMRRYIRNWSNKQKLFNIAAAEPSRLRSFKGDISIKRNAPALRTCFQILLEWNLKKSNRFLVPKIAFENGPIFHLAHWNSLRLLQIQSENRDLFFALKNRPRKL